MKIASFVAASGVAIAVLSFWASSPEQVYSQQPPAGRYVPVGASKLTDMVAASWMIDTAQTPAVVFCLGFRTKPPTMECTKQNLP